MATKNSNNASSKAKVSAKKVNIDNVVKKSGSLFAIGEKVVYPAHGLGEVVSIENVAVAGQTIEMYKVFFTKEGMYSFIPSDKLKKEGVRKLCSKEMVNKVFEILAKPSKANRSTWTKRVQEYEMKMYSGSIMLVAEMVRSLSAGLGDQNRSYGERVIYENAFYRVASEIAAVLKQDISQVEQKINSIITDSRQKSEKSQKLEALAKLNNDDFED